MLSDFLKRFPIVCLVNHQARMLAKQASQSSKPADPASQQASKPVSKQASHQANKPVKQASQPGSKSAKQVR